jgi:hypothetical protein
MDTKSLKKINRIAVYNSNDEIQGKSEDIVKIEED